MEYMIFEKLYDVCRRSIVCCWLEYILSPSAKMIGNLLEGASWLCHRFRLLTQSIGLHRKGSFESNIVIRVDCAKEFSYRSLSSNISWLHDKWSHIGAEECGSCILITIHICFSGLNSWHIPRPFSTENDERIYTSKMAYEYYNQHGHIKYSYSQINVAPLQFI